MVCITVPAVVAAIPTISQVSHAWLSGGGLRIAWAQDINGNVKITIDGVQVTNGATGGTTFPGTGGANPTNAATFSGISQTVSHNICVVGV